jgi:hypothetical protein
MTAFLQFVKEARKNPEAHGITSDTPLTEISKKCADEWRNMSEAEKEVRCATL